MSSLCWGSLRALRRFILPFDRLRATLRAIEGLRGPAPRGYNGDGENVEGTACASGTAQGLSPLPCRESSFADKQ